MRKDTIKKNDKAREMEISISEALKKLRITCGLTQKDLSERSGITVQQIQKYESGKSKVSASILYHTLKVLDVKATEFFDMLDTDLEHIQKLNAQSCMDPQELELIELFNEMKSPVLKNTFLKFMKEFYKGEIKLSK